jgi:hypothetical protein
LPLKGRGSGSFLDRWVLGGGFKLVLFKPSKDSVSSAKGICWFEPGGVRVTGDLADLDRIVSISSRRLFISDFCERSKYICVGELCRSILVVHSAQGVGLVDIT